MKILYFVAHLTMNYVSEMIIIQQLILSNYRPEVITLQLSSRDSLESERLN